MPGHPSSASTTSSTAAPLAEDAGIFIPDGKTYVQACAPSCAFPFALLSLFLGMCEHQDAHTFSSEVLHDPWGCISRAQPCLFLCICVLDCTEQVHPPESCMHQPALPLSPPRRKATCTSPLQRDGEVSGHRLSMMSLHRDTWGPWQVRGITPRSTELQV